MHEVGYDLLTPDSLFALTHLRNIFYRILNLCKASTKLLIAPLKMAWLDKYDSGEYNFQSGLSKSLNGQVYPSLLLQ